MLAELAMAGRAARGRRDIGFVNGRQGKPGCSFRLLFISWEVINRWNLLCYLCGPQLLLNLQHHY
jgi:hypothetical protein